MIKMILRDPDTGKTTKVFVLKDKFENPDYKPKDKNEIWELFKYKVEKEKYYNKILRGAK